MKKIILSLLLITGLLAASIQTQAQCRVTFATKNDGGGYTIQHAGAFKSIVQSIGNTGISGISNFQVNDIEIYQDDSTGTQMAMFNGTAYDSSESSTIYITMGFSLYEDAMKFWMYNPSEMGEISCGGGSFWCSSRWCCAEKCKPRCTQWGIICNCYNVRSSCLTDAVTSPRCYSESTTIDGYYGNIFDQFSEVTGECTE